MLLKWNGTIHYFKYEFKYASPTYISLIFKYRAKASYKPLFSNVGFLPLVEGGKVRRRGNVNLFPPCLITSLYNLKCMGLLDPVDLTLRIRRPIVSTLLKKTKYKQIFEYTKLKVLESLNWSHGHERIRYPANTLYLYPNIVKFSKGLVV